MTEAQLADGPFKPVLLTCAAGVIISLVLPLAGSAAGWQFLAATDAARDTGANIAEYLFAWFSLIGLGVLGTVAMLAKRYRVAAVGWVLTAMSLVFAVLSMWLRNTTKLLDIGHGPGFYLALVAVAIGVFAYVPAITRRAVTPSTQTAPPESNELAQLQRAATEAHSGNPLLVDDRRARAARRHKQQ